MAGFRSSVLRKPTTAARVSPIHDAAAVPAPSFDRLNQSPKDWLQVADRAWELQRNRFLQSCADWVREGVDEEIVEATPARGRGTKRPAQVGGRNRGNNTPIERRYEWAAKYLIKVPLKEIAGADAEASTVGRIARETVRSAGGLPRSDQQSSPSSVNHNFRRSITPSRTHDALSRGGWPSCVTAESAYVSAIADPDARFGGGDLGGRKLGAT